MRSGIRCSIRQHSADGRDVRGFQSVLLDLGARLGLPGMVHADGSPVYRDYADYIVRHERAPGVGLLAGWRGDDGAQHGKGAPNPRPARALHRQRRLLARRNSPSPRATTRWPTAIISSGRSASASSPAPSRSCCSCIRKRCRSSASPHKATARSQPPQRASRARGRPISIRCRSGTSRSRTTRPARETFPLNAVTQRPMFMYHAWGSQNAWLRQIATRNFLYLHPDTGARHRHRRRRLDRGGLAPRHASACRRDSPRNVQPDTVWSWNAIGKRKRRMDAGRRTRRNRTQGFLLNHLISDITPEGRLRQCRSGHRAGGVVRPARAHPQGGRRDDERAAVSSARLRRSRRTPAALRRRFPQCAASGKARREGTQMTDLPPPSKVKLGLVIDLDTCVGCHACAVSCKEWNSGGVAGPLTDENPYGKDPDGRLVQPRAQLRGRAGIGARRSTRSRTAGDDPALPALLPALRNAGLRDRVPDRRQLQARRGRHRAGRRGQVHRLQAVLLGLPVRRARVFAGRRRDEEMHAVRRPHLQRESRPKPSASRPACRPARPSARHFGDLGDPESKVSKLVAERGGVALLPELGYAPVNRYLPPRPRRASDEHAPPHAAGALATEADRRLAALPPVLALASTACAPLSR